MTAVASEVVLAQVISLDPESPARIPAQRRLADLVAAVERTRAPLPEQVTRAGGLAVLHQAELRSGLRAGELDRAEDAAMALWHRHGLTRVYAVVDGVLDAVASERASGVLPMLEERLAVAAAERLVGRLHRRTPSPSGDVVVVVAGPGAAAGVTARASAHVLEEAGRRTVVVEASVGAQLAGCPGVAAVLPPDASPVALLAELGRGPLTPREGEVLQGVADGLTNAEVGERLGVGAATVRSHLDRVFAKTGTTHRAGAVAVALRAGWVS